MKIEGNKTKFEELNIGETFELAGTLFLKIRNEHIEAGKNLETVYNLNAIDLTKNKIVSIPNEEIILKRNAKIVME